MMIASLLATRSRWLPAVVLVLVIHIIAFAFATGQIDVPFLYRGPQG
ncbi:MULTISPECIES: hypothetical protein [unclassified Beijerinckia]|nr:MULTISPECIES: hypothetical protein [unclassified Beijerinckia]MDH7799296.1 hypothetical protein [Beijerinckia sp. GAS462]SED45291.1 hypothetical protein SAMN05443249_5414 [Beijerinckia sp. 28-YEA-48]